MIILNVSWVINNHISGRGLLKFRQLKLLFTCQGKTVSMILLTQHLLLAGDTISLWCLNKASIPSY